jgi:hypothetical protein
MALLLALLVAPSLPTLDQSLPRPFAPAAAVDPLPVADPEAVVPGLPPAPALVAVDPMRPTTRTRTDTLLPHHRLVVFYGNPLADNMGVLGEGLPEAMLDRLARQAAEYAVLDPSRPIRPALDLITPVAQEHPGEDGTYRARMTTAVIDRVAAWAERHSFLLFLDVQIGRSTVEEELYPLRPYLMRPYVHLALDPEFAMPPGEVPGETIGTMDAAQVNTAIRALSTIVAEENLPPKVLIVHRFLESMLTNEQAIVHDPRVQVVIDMDGFGNPYVKTAKYDEFLGGSRARYAAIKLFYQHDVPLMSPADVLGLTPTPDVVIYQ